MEGRRKSLVDITRNKNFLRNSFGTARNPSVLTREEYLTALRSERDQWKTLCTNKKKEVKRKQPDVVIKREEVINSLSEEDLAFLNGRPDYLSISKKAQNYIQTKIFYQKLDEQHKQRWDMLVEDDAEVIDATVDKLLAEENELCSVCNNGLCTRELHQLLGKDPKFSDIISDMVSLQLQDC